MAPAWRRLREGRLSDIADWRRQNLRGFPTGSALVYPFGGPDLLNACAFFPGQPSYTLMGLEPVGAIPSLASLAGKKSMAFYNRLRISLGDLVERNYFITSRMQRHLNQPGVNGVLPVLLATLAGLGNEIIAVDATYLAAVSERGSSEATIFFRRPGHAIQRVTYLSFDASDKALVQSPAAVARVDALRRGELGTITFIKSASYLLHGPHFQDMRAAIIAATAHLLQDDTGIPYRLLPDSSWEVKLFGRYHPPIRDFGRFGYQVDLERAYRDQAPAALPFAFGYHWQDGKSSLLAATRR
jgi:hypothetical protein